MYECNRVTVTHWMNTSRVSLIPAFKKVAEVFVCLTNSHLQLYRGGEAVYIGYCERMVLWMIIY